MTESIGPQSESRYSSRARAVKISICGVKYHARGGPWLRRGLWHEASGTTGGEFHSARTRPRGDSRGTSNTRTHRVCHRNSGRLLPPWRVCPRASAPSRGRDTGPAHRVLSRNGCADFARPITRVPNSGAASRYIKTGTQPGGRTSPPPHWGRETRAAFRLDEDCRRNSSDHQLLHGRSIDTHPSTR